MKTKEFLGVKIISYYNMILPLVFIFGSLIALFFAKNFTEKTSQIIITPFLFLIIVSLFFIFSAINYLNHKKIGRVCLIYSCLIQFFYGLSGLIGTLKAIGTAPITNVIVLAIASWGLWYLNTEEAKNWIKQ